MADIKPDEISAILRQQLSNANVSADLEEIGTVLQVGDGIPIWLEMYAMVNWWNLKTVYVR
jgi:F0F1-type ATP synthase alpha subunit